MSSPYPPPAVTSDILVSQMGFGPSWDSFSEAGSKDIIQAPTTAPPTPGMGQIVTSNYS